MHDMTPRAPQNRSLIWSDNVLDLHDALLSLKLPDALYIVGGAVRDAYLQRPVKDLDLATPGDAIQIARQMTNLLRGDIFVMDAERGVARVLVDTPEGRLTIDVARFRGDTLLDDLLGRDFTLNAMAVDVQGDLSQLIDPLGGEQDVLAKVVRRCTEDSLADDPIRSIRAVRQGVQLGFRLEPETIRDVRRYGAQISETSAERVRDEFFKLLALPDVRKALRVLMQLGLLATILPEVAPLPEIRLDNGLDGWSYTLEVVQKLSNILTIISYQRSDNSAATFQYGLLAMQLDRFRAQLNEDLGIAWPGERSHRALLMLGALLHRIPDAEAEQRAETASKRAHALRLSNPEKKRIHGMIAHYQDAQTLDYEDVLALHRYWYPLQERGIDALLLALAVYLAQAGTELEQDAWLVQVDRAQAMLDAYYTRHADIVSPTLLMNGQDLMEALDVEGGPIIGDLLRVLREGQVTGTITSREDALTAARAYLRDVDAMRPPT